MLNDDMRIEMCTKKEHENLEKRVFQLEANVASPDNPDMKLLQQQLDRLDPALRFLAILKVKCSNASARISSIE